MGRSAASGHVTLCGFFLHQTHILIAWLRRCASFFFKIFCSCKMFLSSGSTVFRLVSCTGRLYPAIVFLLCLWFYFATLLDRQLSYFFEQSRCNQANRMPKAVVSLFVFVLVNEYRTGVIPKIQKNCSI